MLMLFKNFVLVVYVYSHLSTLLPLALASRFTVGRSGSLRNEHKGLTYLSCPVIISYYTYIVSNRCA